MEFGTNYNEKYSTFTSADLKVTADWKVKHSNGLTIKTGAA